MRASKTGLAIVLPSLLVALVNAWAFRAFPDQWGGPNIGGGALQVLAYLGIIIGVIVIIGDVHTERVAPRPRAPRP